MPNDPQIPVDYRTAEALAPVTRFERLAVVMGYVLLFAGLGMLYILTHTDDARDGLLWTAIAMLLIGAGLTAFCYIYNAVRRW